MWKVGLQFSGHSVNGAQNCCHAVAWCPDKKPRRDAHPLETLLDRQAVQVRWASKGSSVHTIFSGLGLDIVDACLTWFFIGGVGFFRNILELVDGGTIPFRLGSFLPFVLPLFIPIPPVALVTASSSIGSGVRALIFPLLESHKGCPVLFPFGEDPPDFRVRKLGCASAKH